MKKSDLYKGKKVHYRTEIRNENGIVKSVTSKGAFVVYHWADEPENFENFTGQLTPFNRLFSGWVLSEEEEDERTHLTILVENNLKLLDSQKKKLQELHDKKYKPFGMHETQDIF